jgi:hypothetical protein
MAKIGPDGNFEPRDLFSLSSTPMSPKFILERPPDGRVLGSPKHQTVKKIARAFERDTRWTILSWDFAIVRIYVFALHGFSELRDLFSISSSPTNSKSNLKKSPGDRAVGSPKHRTVSFWCARFVYLNAIDR